MRAQGSTSSARSVFGWLVLLLVLGALGVATLWGREQETARFAAEGRAEAAESQLALARAEVADLLRVQAVASATASATTNAPTAALENALALVFEAYKDPVDSKLSALREALSPSAMAFARPEAEHLISGGLHLGGESRYEVEILETNQASPESVEFRTRENWTYDEVDTQNRRVRCVREQSEQRYMLRRTSLGAWIIDDIELVGSPRRIDC